MRTARILAILALASLGAAVPRPSGGSDELLRDQAVLSAEYGLARAPGFYFVLDVPGKTLDLRARGMVLRSWPLRSMRFWGHPAFQGTVELRRKSALRVPERIVVRPPGEGEPATAGAESGSEGFEVEALELKDMPGSFGLEFDNGFHVAVRSAPAARSGPLGMAVNAWKWHVALPIKSLLGLGKQGSRAWLELVFENKRDAQAIYWHFAEGINGLVF
jgi:hypothetical protein